METRELPQVSPEFERVGRHELQRVRRPVKIHHVELHRWVGLTGLEMRHSRDPRISASSSWPVLLPPTTRGQLLVTPPCLPLGKGTVFLWGTSCRWNGAKPCWAPDYRWGPGRPTSPHPVTTSGPRGCEGSPLLAKTEKRGLSLWDDVSGAASRRCLVILVWLKPAHVQPVKRKRSNPLTSIYANEVII